MTSFPENAQRLFAMYWAELFLKGNSYIPNFDV